MSISKYHPTKIGLQPIISKFSNNENVYEKMRSVVSSARNYDVKKQLNTDNSPITAVKI